jgi:hypothetical protein
VVSVLLRFKDSDYPFGICKLFLPVSEYLLISVSQMTMSFFPLSCFTNTVVSNHFHSVKKKIVSSARSRDSDGMDFNTCIIVHSIRFTLLVFSYFYAPCSCVCVLEFVLYDFLLLMFCFVGVQISFLIYVFIYVYWYPKQFPYYMTFI